ncbi:hypothetical protein DOTSEDRAFT_34334 [Dothistroma septosporum NZE10]|uniref:Uncharacterized protein n=1 Tax=Dothistroma septosporum (strain NZE10 / CBS 128990) TaxID=675120 RepID=N1PMY8_DOTSN|nr:hypothetical protein DOTSEDRAFT_34334 [Dothistroma septosporum NZE10]
MGKGEVKCPFEDECAFKSTADKVLQHTLREVDQSKDHLLNAARAGLFSRDFDVSEARSVGRVKAVGKQGEGLAYQAFEDPADFNLAAHVPPRNITADGDLQRDDNAVKYEGETIRLPPKTGLVDSTLWQEYIEGIHGRLPDILQQQRAFIARRAEAALRQHNVQQDHSGATRSQAAKGKGNRTVETRARLRLRLEEIGFPWAGGEAEVADEEDEDDETGGAQGEEETEDRSDAMETD